MKPTLLLAVCCIALAACPTYAQDLNNANVFAQIQFSETECGAKVESGLKAKILARLIAAAELDQPEPYLERLRAELKPHGKEVVCEAVRLALSGIKVD